ncbi:hypothetical protein [Pseudoruegeria sp. SK021]|uniref:hypothetical protein n=1 Tax=Pseudoruegeria sp. SK021 TaxID=1933035 RepID=UPI00111C8F80|nr:hypothetical protein [Pseudoruegeria sp. SK021]
MIRLSFPSLPFVAAGLALFGLAACDGGLSPRKAPSAAELQTQADFDQRIAPSLAGQCAPEVISGLREVAVLAVTAQMAGDSGAMRNAAAQGQTITANASPACMTALQSIPAAT